MSNATRTVMLVVISLFLASCATSDPLSGPLAIEKQGSFFIGGRTIKSETLSASNNPAFPPSGTVVVDQMYVRYQVPVGATRPPLVLIHGCCLTGKTWETTPDGRMGWDEYFVRKGHPVYVIDQIARGRSGANTSLVTSVRAGKTPAGESPAVFMASQEAIWTVARFGPEHPKVYPGMQYPIEAVDGFWQQMVPDWFATMPTPNPNVAALSMLAEKVDGAVLVGWSQSGIFTFQAAALSTRGIRAIVAIEPSTCPAATGDLAPYLKMPVMFLWGDNTEGTRWGPRVKACGEFVDAVNKAGGKAKNVVLPAMGIEGNTHVMMQDRNSHEVADVVLGFLAP